MKKVLIGSAIVLGVLVVMGVLLFVLGGRDFKSQTVIVIERNPEQVFPYLVEDDKQLRWLDELVETEPGTDGPTEAGSHSRVVLQDGGKQKRAGLDVTHFRRNELLAGKLMGEAPSGYEIVFRVELEGIEEGTQLYFEIVKRHTSFPARLFAIFTSRQTQTNLDENMAALKKLVEEEAAFDEDSWEMWGEEDDGYEEWDNDGFTDEDDGYRDEEAMMEGELAE